MFGITSFHIRLLCDNPWEGGGGYTTEQVASMTPDQIYFRLCDRDLLKGGKRTKTVSPYGLKPDKDGFIKGRDKDGNPIKLRMAGDGKSLCQRLQEQEQEKHVEEKQGKRRRKRGS